MRILERSNDYFALYQRFGYSIYWAVVGSRRSRPFYIYIKSSVWTKSDNMRYFVRNIWPIANLRKFAKKNKKKTKRDDGSWTNPVLKTLDLFSETHLPGCKKAADSEQSWKPVPRLTAEEEWLMDIKLFQAFLGYQHFLTLSDPWYWWYNTGNVAKFIRACISHITGNILRFFFVPNVWNEVTATYIPKAR